MYANIKIPYKYCQSIRKHYVAKINIIKTVRDLILIFKQLDELEKGYENACNEYYEHVCDVCE